MKLPLKVNMGFKLRCCEDLRLISFRCWLAGVWLWEGTHTFLLSVITAASVGLAWKNRAPFVPSARLASRGRLQQRTDNTQPVQIQMEKLIYN